MRVKCKPKPFCTAEDAEGGAADKVPEFLREKDKNVLWVEPKTKPRSMYGLKSLFLVSLAIYESLDAFFDYNLWIPSLILRVLKTTGPQATRISGKVELIFYPCYHVFAGKREIKLRPSKDGSPKWVDSESRDLLFLFVVLIFRQPIEQLFSLYMFVFQRPDFHSVSEQFSPVLIHGF